MLDKGVIKTQGEEELWGYLTKYTVYVGQKIALRSILKAHFQKVKAEKGITLGAIGLELARLMKKKEPYTESYLSRLANIEMLPKGWGKGTEVYEHFLDALEMDEEAKASVWAIIHTLRYLEKGLETGQTIDPLPKDKLKWYEPYDVVGDRRLDRLVVLGIDSLIFAIVFALFYRIMNYFQLWDLWNRLF